MLPTENEVHVARASVIVLDDEILKAPARKCSAAISLISARTASVLAAPVE
jgi:hypothetical protein